MSTNPKIHNLKGGKFQLSYTTPYSQRRRRLKYDSYEDAQEAGRLAELRYRPHLAKDMGSTNVGDLIDYHLARRPNTRVMDGRRSMVEDFRRKFGTTPLAEVTKVELENWLYESTIFPRPYDRLDRRHIDIKIVRHDWHAHQN